VERQRTGIDLRDAGLRVRTVLVAIAGRLGARDVELTAYQVSRTIRRLQQSTAEVDLARDDGNRPRPIRWNWLAPVALRHERRPRRRCQHAALRVVFDLLRSIQAEPHAGDEVCRVADEPDVGAVV